MSIEHHEINDKIDTEMISHTQCKLFVSSIIFFDDFTKSGLRIFFKRNKQRPSNLFDPGRTNNAIAACEAENLKYAASNASLSLTVYIPSISGQRYAL